jgi:hypothetical protein
VTAFTIAIRSGDEEGEGDGHEKAENMAKDGGGKGSPACPIMSLLV